MSKEKNRDEGSKTGRDNIRNLFYDGKKGGDRDLKEGRALGEGKMASKIPNIESLVRFLGYKQ